MRGRSPTFAVWLTLWSELVRIRSETGADGGGIMARIYFVCLQTANAACLPAVKPTGVHFVTYTIDDIEVVHAAHRRTSGLSDYSLPSRRCWLKLVSTLRKGRGHLSCGIYTLELVKELFNERRGKFNKSISGGVTRTAPFGDRTT